MKNYSAATLELCVAHAHQGAKMESENCYIIYTYSYYVPSHLLIGCFFTSRRFIFADGFIQIFMASKPNMSFLTVAWMGAF